MMSWLRRGKATETRTKTTNGVGYQGAGVLAVILKRFLESSLKWRLLTMNNI